MTVRLGFVLAQVAGHVTHGHNLRRVVDGIPGVEADWCEIRYHAAGGRIERVAGRIGRGMALRPVVELARSLRDVHADAYFVNASAADVLQHRFHTTPTVVDFDATPVQLAAMPEYGWSLGSAPVRRLRRWTKRRLWDGVALIETWSEWAKASVVDDYGVDASRVMVNPPGVDLMRWSPPTSGRAHEDRPRRILFVGADFERKGGDLLLDWFRRARPADTELHLVTRGSVDEALPGVVVHRDLVPNSDRLVELYRTSDVFVLPSRAECFGIATVEAMATGLPVVVAETGAAAEIVADGHNGHLVAPGRVEPLGEALMALLDDEAGRRRMGEVSRRLAEERFDVVVNATRTITTMIDLAAGS